MSFISNAIGSLFGTTQQADAATLASQQQAQSQAAAQAALQKNLAPYSQIGTAVLPQLLKSLGYNGTFDSSGNISGITGSGFQFNPTDLQNTPGYQFTLNQGLQGVNNQMSSQGLLGSGAQQKAIANYTTGLAQNTYNQQYQNALSQYMTNAGQLGNLLNLGQNAAAGIGQGAYNSNVNAGNALAAGTTAAGSQTANTMNSLLGAGKAAASIYSVANTPSVSFYSCFICIRNNMDFAQSTNVIPQKMVTPNFDQIPEGINQILNIQKNKVGLEQAKQSLLANKAPYLKQLKKIRAKMAI